MSLADEMKELAAVSTSEILKEQRQHKIKQDRFIEDTLQKFRDTIQQQAKLGMTDCVLKRGTWAWGDFDFDLVLNQLVGKLIDDGFTVVDFSDKMHCFICFNVSWK